MSSYYRVSLFLVLWISQCILLLGQSNTELLNKTLTTGWNTFDNRNIMSHVYLPDGLAIHMKVHNPRTDDTLTFAFTGNRVIATEKTRVIAHTPDGSYTDFTMNWQDTEIRVQSISEAKELSILITNLRRKTPANIIVDPYFMYGGSGDIKTQKGSITSKGNKSSFEFKIWGSNQHVIGNSIYVELEAELFISNAGNNSHEIRSKIISAANRYAERISEYGITSTSYDAIQNLVNWNVVFDPVKNRVVTPVARTWAYGWGNGEEGGYVLFCWDNFFAAFMHAIESKELAFNEALQMCYEIDDLGFVPNYSGPNNVKSRDRSQPPVGSMMIKEIYKLHPEKWFLEETFDRLLVWNRWWKDTRDNNGFLCWGSTPFEGAFDKRMKTQHEFDAASNESGLDNTPMYDDVKFNKKTNMLEMGDVGLMGLYIADCEALADIAEVLNRPEQDELRERAEYYRNNLKKLWDNDFGMFLNIHTDTDKLSRRISPTNFYALLGKAATQEQAERMVNEHFYNPDEFWGEYILPSIVRNDTAYTGKDYWRGSIWAPMNFLTYLSFMNYDLPKARRDLADKSRQLLDNQWKAMRYVRENYHAETGGDPGYRSEHFYHWGALLGMINLIEYNKLNYQITEF